MTDKLSCNNAEHTTESTAAAPRFSVIVPLYNKAPYVAKCLQSILSQSFTAFEVVIVDDGSTDDSADIVRGFQDDRIKLIAQPNQGVSAARNRGIGEARCDLVAFLDADDWWGEDYLCEMARLADLYPDVSLYCAVYAHVQQGQIHVAKLPIPAGGPYIVFDAIEESVRRGTFLLPFSSSSTVIRKDILAKAGLFDTRLSFYEDYDLFIRASVFSRCGAFVGKALAFYVKDVPAAERATGCLFPLGRSLVGNLGKLDEFQPLHPALSDYVDCFRLFNLMPYVEAGYPAEVIQPLVRPTDPRRLTWVHRLYYAYTPGGRLFVWLNVRRRRFAAMVRSIVRSFSPMRQRSLPAQGEST